MKHVQLFEDFIKNYGDKISQQDFKKLTKLKKKQKVLYYGQEHEVLDSDGIIARLRNTQSGETTTVNLSMFNQKGAIVENEELNEGFYDKGILKAFFMAGGPGSGKSHVATELFGFPKGAMSSTSYETGLKLINSDNAFEALAKEAGFDLGKMGQIKGDEWDRLMDVRNRAKGLTKKMQKNYLIGRLGMVIDGTGKNADKIKMQRMLLSDGLGYDSYMVFVNTSLEVALERNQKRERTVPDELVTKMWQEVQNNIGKFQNIFGHDKVFIVDNSEYGETETLDQIEKLIRKEILKPVQNNTGKTWLRMNDPKLKSKNRPS